MQSVSGNSVISKQHYVPGTEDLPVYDGFNLIESGNVAYDSESGRIIDATYSGGVVREQDVLDFYAQTMPQLGWKKNKLHAYIRDGEKLKISITQKNGVMYLTFTIRPVT